MAKRQSNNAKNADKELTSEYEGERLGFGDFSKALDQVLNVEVWLKAPFPILLNALLYAL